MNETKTTAPVEDSFGFSFDAPQTTTAKAKGKRTEYPIAPDPDGSLAIMAVDYRAAKDKCETGEAEMKKLRPRIVEKTQPFWMSTCSGMAEAPSSVAVLNAEKVEELLVLFPDKYSLGVSVQDVKNITGPEVLKQWFRPKFQIKIKSEDLPETPETQKFINELLAVAKKFNFASAIEWKQVAAPRKGFSDARHRVLSPEQNLQLCAVLPIIANLKTKGRAE